MNHPPEQQTHNAIRKAQNGVGRSPFYEWLLEIHDDLKARGSRLGWTSICARAAELGKHDGTGKPPTPERATKTWSAVRVAKAAEAAMRQTEPANAVQKGPEQERARLPDRTASSSRPNLVQQKESTPPAIRDPTVVAPIPERLAPTTKEVRPIPHTKHVATPGGHPSADAMNTPKAKLAMEQMQQTMAELRKRSNERNGVF